MFQPNFVPRQSETPAPVLINGARILGFYTDIEGRAGEVQSYVDDNLKGFDVKLVGTEPNPQDDHPKLTSAHNELNPQLITAWGGDDTHKRLIQWFYDLSETQPDVLDIPIVFVARGTGNDYALSVTKGGDLLDILAKGHVIDYRPIQVNDRYAVSSTGVGAAAKVQQRVNSDHPRHKDGSVKFFGLAKAAVSAVAESKNFVTEEIDIEGEPFDERVIFSREYAHVRRFGIYGRTGARATDDYLREAVLGKKLNPITLATIASFGLGLVNLRVPTHKVTEEVHFRVKDTDAELYMHLDDTEHPVQPGDEFRVKLADQASKVYTDRRRP